MTQFTDEEWGAFINKCLESISIADFHRELAASTNPVWVQARQNRTNRINRDIKRCKSASDALLESDVFKAYENAKKTFEESKDWKNYCEAEEQVAFENPDERFISDPSSLRRINKYLNNWMEKAYKDGG